MHGYLVLWDMKRNLQLWKKSIHPKGVRIVSVAFSHDDTKIVSGSNRGDVTITSVDDGSILFNMDRHDGLHVRTVAFSPNDDMVVSGGTFERLIAHNVHDGSLVAFHMRGHQKMVSVSVFSPDGSMIASGGIDSKVCLWSSVDGSWIHTMRGHDRGIVSLAFSPDGQCLASGSADHTCRLWSTLSGQQLHLLSHGWHSDVNHVLFTPNGRNILTYAGNNLCTWSRFDGSLLCTTHLPCIVRAPRFILDGQDLSFLSVANYFTYELVTLSHYMVAEEILDCICAAYNLPGGKRRQWGPFAGIDKLLKRWDTKRTPEKAKAKF